MGNKSNWGKEEAIKLLKSLSLSERERLLNDMGKSDPALAKELKDKLIDLEDLIYLTPKMLVEFMRSIDIKDLALALRVSSQELKAYFLKNLSANLRSELESALMGPPKLVREIDEAKSRIISMLDEKMAKGELVLSKDSDRFV